MDKKSTDIGNNIKKARKKANLTQTELAQQLEKTLRTIQKYESGEIQPSIATINLISNILNVSPADLVGYKKQEINLNNISDILTFVYKLNKKAGIRFEIEVHKPPHYDEWTCSLKFDGKNTSAEYNSSICLILEKFALEREHVEKYWHTEEAFEHWLEKSLAYYSDTILQDKEKEVLTLEERIKRRDEIILKEIEEKQKAAEKNDSQQ